MSAPCCQLPNLGAPWDFSSCCLTAADTHVGEMLDVYMRRLVKERDWGGIDHAVSEAFVNNCPILVADKDENRTHFTSSTMFLLEKIS